MKDIRYSSNVVGKKMWMAATMMLYIWSSEAFIGMNWGRQSAQRLVPSQAVDLLMQNGIRHARVYSSEDDILEAFVDTGIDLTVSMVHGTKLFLNMSQARTWVQNKSKYLKHSNISQLTIGGYLFFTGVENKAEMTTGMEALKNLQQALDEVGHYGITVNLVQHPQMLKPNIMRPSEAEFRDEIISEVTHFVRFLQERRAPFLLEMFPILDSSRQNFNTSFAFPDNHDPPVKDVNGALYTNIFDFTYDSHVWALRKINATELRVVVAQVGWPTDAHVGASCANAERFYRHLLPAVASDRGTPMRPGAPVDIYVHALTDETKMVYADPFARHWGVYRSNGEPKFKIDLSGRGRNMYPATMRGIMKMPRRWCVFNGNRSDIFYVRSQLEYACKKGDCTSTTTGGSCGRLRFDQNVSYAFNMLFQFKFQDEKACDFGGLGRVAVTDPSTGDCVFPIEVVKGQQINLAYA